MSLKNIFNEKIFIKGIGHIYPVTMENYDEFMENSNVLSYSYQHFDTKEIAKQFQIEETDLKLLDLVALAAKQSDTYEETFKGLSIMFSIVLQRKISHRLGKYGVEFVDEEFKVAVNRDNYDLIRSIIMKQNIMFEAKAFKNPIVAEWAEAVLNERSKNAIDIGIEDMITTISIISGKHYWDLKKYSIYQVKADFARITKDKNYHTGLAARLAGNSDVEIGHYAENPELYRHPYDDIFKSKSKLNKLDEVMK